MKIIFNTGVFGKHGIERALSNILLELPPAVNQYILHQIYELDFKSQFLDEINSIVTHDCALPRISFWGNLHMNRRKSIFHKLIDSIGLLKIHSLIAENINRHQADIVVDYDLSLLRSAHLINAPKIGVFHFRPKRFRNGGANKLRRIGERLHHYQKLVVLCDEMYQEACYVWPHLKDKLIVLPNPINLPLLIKKSEEPVKLPAEITAGEYFISIARLTHQKNIALLLRSYKLAKELGCTWPLVIVGDGEDKNILTQLSADLAIMENVLFLGYQTNPHPYLAKAGAFVMSSREEGFPVSLLEAMALGCPIISLACPTGPTDILQHGRLGKLIAFTEDNPHEIGKAMLEMSNNAGHRKNYSEESKLFVEKFSSPKIAEQMMSLLRDIASNQKS
ncbi:glycosyltransferase [Polynucleobacter sp. AM-26B4]|uniref:glycosyltransferase n=1 Tax=Polynucleobacter sp. AM-26B4 TaxID=2689103 RepID=UPI001C0BB447|nr:glycosyltransferase [Polynucleobacter sp. AM-26B4]MBU3585118.1 glycosyltransferase [Polynucleobacter sp. AM-26B4]